jgi:hypothetical protein
MGISEKFRQTSFWTVFKRGAAKVLDFVSMYPRALYHDIREALQTRQPWPVIMDVVIPLVPVIDVSFLKDSTGAPPFLFVPIMTAVLASVVALEQPLVKIDARRNFERWPLTKRLRHTEALLGHQHG